MKKCKLDTIKKIQLAIRHNQLDFLFQDEARVDQKDTTTQICVVTGILIHA